MSGVTDFRVDKSFPEKKSIEKLILDIFDSEHYYIAL